MIKKQYCTRAHRAGRLTRLVLLAGLGLSGCSALPASGPTEREVLAAEKDANNQIGFHIVNITPAVVAALTASPAPLMARMDAGRGFPRTDAIGPGDLLGITIYEVGSGLFSGGGTPASGTVGNEVPGSNGSATGTRLPAVPVDASGDIALPFVGRLHAAGRTPAALADAIRAGLHNVSQDPQVLVTVAESVAASAYVLGDVRNPGRRQLTLNHERLLDVVALSGGTTHPSSDMRVELIRGGRQIEVPLIRLEQDRAENIVVHPGDRIRLTHRARSFEVYGASGKVNELPFESADVSLAEGMARAGGPLNERADPNAVFLFRYEPADYVQRIGLPVTQGTDTANLQPVVYKLDLMEPTSYFLMQKFQMRDKDLIYVANARTDRITKLMAILYNLAFPAALARQLAN